MTEHISTPETASTIRAAPMGHHAAGGAAWALMQTVASKFLGVASQFAVAYILDQRAVGATYQAFAIMAIPSVIQRFGITELLVQRQRRFDKLATAGFWISVTSGFLVAAISVLCAAYVGFYKLRHPVPGVTESPWLLSHLIIVCGIGNAIDGFTAVPQAKLRVQLQFRRLNLIALTYNFIMGTLTILFLLLGMGPMSLMLPRTLAKVYEFLATWRSARITVRMTPDFARWRFLLHNGAILSLFLFCGTMIQNADNMAVGLFQGEYSLGIYGFAFNLSTQSVQLLALSLTPTFFSIFAKLVAEPQRQVDAFMRSAKVLNVIVVPLCFLQAAVAAPLLHFFYGTKWDGAIPVLQVLSIGMVFAVSSGGVAGLFQAQGRFKTQLAWQFCVGMAFCALMVATAIKGNEFAVSIAVCLFYAVTFPLGAYVAARPGKVSLRRIYSLFSWPIVCSVITCGIPLALLYAGRFLPLQLPIALSHWKLLPPRIINLIEIADISAATLCLYILLNAKVRTDSSDAVMQYVPALANRLRKIPGAGHALRYFKLVDY